MRRYFHEHLLDGLWLPARRTREDTDVVQKAQPKRKGKPVVKPREGVRNIKCVMCQGYVKVGLQYAKCDCGETYHVSCLTRLGFCPMCNKKWTVDQMPSITKSNGDAASSPLSKKLSCPSCGEMVSIYDMECKCGAIFVKENDSFYCPECGGRVSLVDLVCLGCGERFRPCEMVKCPNCGSNFDSLGGPCTCGAFLGDACPECGAHIDIDDAYCPKCGSKIEMI